MSDGYELLNQLEDALGFIERAGYRRCDIPACNCNGWHGGHAAQRLVEIGDALRDAGVDLNGKTLLVGVRELADGARAQEVQSADEYADSMVGGKIIASHQNYSWTIDTRAGQRMRVGFMCESCGKQSWNSPPLPPAPAQE